MFRDLSSIDLYGFCVGLLDSFFPDVIREDLQTNGT